MGNITMGQQELKTYGLGMEVIEGKLYEKLGIKKASQLAYQNH